MCLRRQTVIVGDPTTIEIRERGPAEAATMNHGLTENDAWCSVALTTLGALLVWADTKSPNFLILPVLLMLFFGDKPNKTK